MYIGGPPSEYPDRYRLVSPLSHIKHSAPPAISFVGLSVRFRQVPGLVETLVEFYPEAQWQRCVVHFYRNVWTAKRCLYVLIFDLVAVEAATGSDLAERT